MAMKPSLSLRVSQHLALTPQLQQSIRLLQLSTLDLNQEVEQMLDDNPFLERDTDAAVAEEFGLPKEDVAVSDGDRLREWSDDADAPSSIASSADSTPAAAEYESEIGLEGAADAVNWEGDGTNEVFADEGEWGADDGARGVSAATSGNGDDSDRDAVELAGAGDGSLAAHLHQQALRLRLTPEDRAALGFLIGSLNDEGYLEDDLDDLALGLAGEDRELMDETRDRLRIALRLLQSLEPTGVGARDLGECLSLQLRALRADGDTSPTIDHALGLCRLPLAQLARRDFRKLAEGIGAGESEVRAALALISRLEPKPGRRFANVDREVVIPDVIVLRSGEGARQRFRAIINPDVLPRLRVHDVYAGVLKSHRGPRGGSDSASHAALQQRLQEARWFIRNIQQRFDTILRVASAIVERQRNFFVHGELAMRPLVLREIADELGLHESTISRVTNAKYMATPRGTFEMKYFFGSSLETDTGGAASSTAVRALIRQLIDAEDRKKPLSDGQLSDMLKEQGIDCARRTVAKYREAMRIPTTTLRKGAG